MNVTQILTTQGIHSSRLATVHFTATPKKNYLMKKKQPTFWSHLQIPNVISWSMNSIQFYTTYERINNKAYRGILAVAKNKNQGHKLNS